jgi:hypothetical protein
MMKLTNVVIALAALAALAGCGHTTEEDWVSRTGTSADNSIYSIKFEQPANASGYALVGCLFGSNQHFTLTELSSGTIYHVDGNYDLLKLHVGELVGLNGEKKGGTGVPEFNSGDNTPATVAAHSPAIASGGLNELNQPPAEKRGIAQAVQPPNPNAAPGRTTPPASATPPGQNPPE